MSENQKGKKCGMYKLVIPFNTSNTNFKTSCRLAQKYRVPTIFNL